MKIGKLSLINFQSYSALDFDFAGKGLVGLFGTTGAGKSTLMDGLAWALFGRTGKDGAADDIQSWDAEGSTTGNVMVETSTGIVGIGRVRGDGKNDLFWIEYGRRDEIAHPGEPQRGKDLKDTQKRIEERIGVTSELFLLSGYMTQFSEADSFFIASAKGRREILEKIADQEFAIKLGERTSESRKTAKLEVQSMEIELAKYTGVLDTLKKTLLQTRVNALEWDKNRQVRITQLEAKQASYKADVEAKAAAWELLHIATLDRLSAEIEGSPDTKPLKWFDEEIARLKTESRCAICGSLSDTNNEAIGALREEKLKTKQIEDKDKRLLAEYQAEELKKNPHQAAENPYEHQLDEVRGDDNPFTLLISVYEVEIDQVTGSIEGHTLEIKALKQKLSRLTWLYDKSFEMRGLLMERVVREIQTKTNYYLEKFFDGALRVQLTCQESDKIEAHIANNGHQCPFTALSGGERTMLKLSFGLSLMQAAQNKAGVALNCLMLDEPLNGLPEDLKVKAFGLFEELIGLYETILVIDHSEVFKNCFSSSYFVDKVNGQSMLYER